MGNEILKMQGITKSFPGVLALDNVDLELEKGEVLALVGENGAGKSTLLKIISGAYFKDKGTIEFDGTSYDQYSPRKAIDMGISIIYQELDNYQTLTVAENVLVNQLPRKLGGIGSVNWAETYSKAKKIVGLISKDLDVKMPMSSLSAAQQQLVEISKAMSRNMKILIMDEPTSALNRVETQRLLEIVREIAASGVGVIYISHRMDEIFSVSDRIQVMRDGRSISKYKTSETTTDEIISAMVGRKLDDMYPHIILKPGKSILNVKNIKAGKARDISFNLRAGEVLGLFGLMGAGRTDVARALFGDLHLEKGSVEICEKRMNFASPRDAIANGIAYVPSERKVEGLMLIHPVKFNICISVIDRIKRMFRVDQTRENEIANKWVKRLDIKTTSTQSIVDNLSGGNQQKVVIAKWLETQPKVLILNDPTRGIDVGAKVEIYSLMEELCEQGLGIIMISSELQETLAMSDRIIVMCEGRLTGEVPIAEATQENLMKLAVGGV